MQSRDRLAKVGMTVLAAVLVAIWLYPVFLSIVTSLKTTLQINHDPFGLPSPITIEPYVQAWKATGFPMLLANSLIYGTFGSLLAVLLGILPAYALTRFSIPGSRAIFVLILTTLMLPQQTVIIPLYHLMAGFGLLNTRIGLILVHGVYGMAFELLILSGFVSTIPRDIEMAARVDGCGDIATLGYIVVPLSMPAILVGFVLNFIFVWNEFFFALVFLSSQSVMPVTLGILVARFVTSYVTATNIPAATVLMSQLPIVVLYVVFHKRIGSGIFAGSIKE